LNPWRQARSVRPQAVEAIDGADALEHDDAPRRQGVGRPLHVHAGGEDASFPAWRRKLDDHAKPSPAHAFERGAIALPDHGLHRSGQEEIDLVAANAGRRHVRAEEPAELAAVAAHQHLLEAGEERRHRVGAWAVLCGHRRGRADQAGDEEESSNHRAAVTTPDREAKPTMLQDQGGSRRSA
jgi:hypothetical protein